MRLTYIPTITAAACLWLLAIGARAQLPLGLFDNHTDVGAVLHPGLTDYDAAHRTYTISGSGDNMWFASDAFQFAWKKVSGDVTATANIAFIGAGGEAHRKAVLMIRQSLDADSPYADVARHGDGLTSLQARDEKGANTAEIQSAMKAPVRVRIARRGDYFYFWVAGEGEELHFAGGSMRVPMHDPFYVGIGVCSHNKDAVEKAVFSNVDLSTDPPAASPVLYSTLEVVPVSGDRRVVYVTPGRIESPAWTADGTALIFYREGHAERIPLTGGTPEPIPGSAPKPPELRSPDGQQSASLSPGNDTDVTLQIRSVVDNKVRTLAKLIGGPGTLGAPWSPDSRRLVFISYQHLPQ